MDNEQTQKWWWGPGFYDYPVESGVEITAAYRDELLRGQETGYQIDTHDKGYPILVTPGPKTLDEWREARLRDIDAHDRGPEVNNFSLGDTPTWFDKATRVGLRASLDAEAAAGAVATTLWLGDTPRPVEMPIAEVRTLLAAVEVYSKRVFDVTQRHRAAVRALDSIEALKAYDHTAGYPAPLHFPAGE